ncbi:HPP family protein [uncultured Corynebacterium sp.]|uniref:HPP family protein n=1 Tax=uncultured Corynebacterium sp. TaxID=159447 RepID=UPI002600095E|nr:HPP family protein [uncultured Corynebacterium sp.]
MMTMTTARRILRTQAPARPPAPTVVVATVVSVAALLLLVLIGELSGHLLLIPPMAASMALIVGAPALPLSQPRNVVAGQTLSAVVGVLVGLVSHSLWAAAVAGGLALGAMLLARTPHSPAAATAVLGTLGTGDPGSIGGVADQVSFIVCAAVAALVLVAVGWTHGRVGRATYPVYWW